MTEATEVARPTRSEFEERSSPVSGGELVVRTLLRAGAEWVYLLYGGHLQPICEAIRAHGVPYLDMRNELTAGYAAEGFARATDTFGVAMVSAAPGFTNVLTSITNASIDRTPVVYVSTSAALGDAETNNFMSGIDPVAMAKPITKWAHCVTRTEDIPRLLAHAVRVATSPPTGPVLLDIPWDVVFGLVAEGDVAIPETIQAAAEPLPRTEAIERALALLASAERPAIIAGEGAVGVGVADELRAFVDATGVPVFSCYEGYGLLPTGHRAFGGGTLKLVELGAGDYRPDVVLALGVRFGFMTVGQVGTVPREAKLIHVDVDPAEIGRTRDVEVGIVSASRLALSVLNAGREAHDWPDRSAAHEVLRRGHVERARRETESAAGRDVPIPAYLAAKAIVESIGEDAYVVVDGADTHMWIAEVAQKRIPGRFFSHRSFFGCLGYGLGFAMGVQTAHPGERVVLVSGDGAFGFTLAELHTLARHKLPIVVVVMNNRAWGATSHFQEITSFGHDNQFGVDLSGAEYHDVAIALGCLGERVTRLDQLQPAIEAALASGQPACINVEIDVGDVPPDHKALTFLRS